LASVTALFMVACGADPASQQLVGYRIDPPTSVADLSLPDARTAAPVSFRAAPGGLLVVYFGYTACPDVCPTTLAAVRSALRFLGQDASRVELSMATIDPQRDTNSNFPGYVQSFIVNAHALRTTNITDLRTVTDRFGANFSVTVSSDGTEDVTHTGSLYIVDQHGVVVDTMPFGVTSADIANDLRILLHANTKQG
jgi:protein SCO1/2